MPNDTLGHFTPLDIAAALVLIAAWYGARLLVEHAPRRFPSISNLMAQYRREWMVQFVARDPRIFDSQVIGQLRQSTSFFASTPRTVLSRPRPAGRTRGRECIHGGKRV